MSSLEDLLEKLIKNVKDGMYNEEIKNEIKESLLPYVTGNREPIDKESLKYYITGWWLYQNLKQDNIDT